MGAYLFYPTNYYMNKQKHKTRFRDSARWKKFRIFMRALYRGEDYVTGSQLHKGWNLHHMDMSPKHYGDISDPNNFIPLNRQTHAFIHWIWRYYHKDKAIIHRLIRVLDKMEELNGA